MQYIILANYFSFCHIAYIIIFLQFKFQVRSSIVMMIDFQEDPWEVFCKLSVL